MSHQNIPKNIKLQMASEFMSPAKKSQSASPSSVSGPGNRSELRDNSPKEGRQEKSLPPSQVSSVINSVNEQVAADRFDHIKMRMEENRKKIADLTDNSQKLAQERRHLKENGSTAHVDLLEKRQQEAIDMLNRIDTSNGHAVGTISKVRI